MSPVFSSYSNFKFIIFSSKNVLNINNFGLNLSLGKQLGALWLSIMWMMNDNDMHVGMYGRLTIAIQVSSLNQTMNFHWLNSDSETAESDPSSVHFINWTLVLVQFSSRVGKPSSSGKLGIFYINFYFKNVIMYIVVSFWSFWDF